MVTNTMEAILTSIGAVFTQAITWVGDIIDLIVEQPLLILMVVALPIVGFAVGLLSRLFRA